jgi:hypothetical protein
LHNYDLARVVNDERQREVERRMRIRIDRPPHPPRHSMRQAVGRVLIRLGSLLVADGQIEAGRLRTPGRSETGP